MFGESYIRDSKSDGECSWSYTQTPSTVPTALFQWSFIEYFPHDIFCQTKHLLT